ncbi:MAG: aspartate kinase [Nanoarchaeota archaeon]|nr:aspartate kinase [Nanoarchaeota archaeon]
MRNTVYKFGGGCIGSGAEAIDNMERIAAFLLNKQAGLINGIVVVVSAPAGLTDLLEGAAELNPALSDTPELDELLSQGEIISTQLLLAAINGAGGKATTLTGRDVIVTDDQYGNAAIVHVDISRIEEELAKGNIVIVAGFQGATPEGRVTTLGRGGSDTTAVALAEALGAECVICKETKGIHTADPIIVLDAPVVRTMTFRELRESARNGAKVIAPSAANLAEKGNVPIRVMPAFEAGEGTLISAERKGATRTVTTITSANHPLVRVSVAGNPQTISSTLRRLADRKVNVEDIAETDSSATFTINERDLYRTKAVLRDCKNAKYRIMTGFGRVTIVGEAIENTPGVAARMREALEKGGIEIQGSTSSDITISCLVHRHEVERAIHALHAEFID